MLFAKGDMASLMKKFFDALNPGGVLLVVSEGIAEDLSGPWDMMTGYLPYFLNGMDLAVRAGEVEAERQASPKLRAVPNSYAPELRIFL